MTVPRRRGARGRQLRTSLQGYLFVAPAFVLLIVFVAGPAIWVIGLSTFNWDLIGSGVFAGLHNYVQLVQDPTWWQSFVQTLYFVVVSVPLGMALGLLLALLLNRPILGRSVFRGAVFAPYVTPAVATLVIWQWIFNRSYGLLNALLATFHIPPVGWLIDPRAIMPAVIIYTLWSTVGFSMVIFLSGLANVPDELREAAQVDGAGRWHVFRHVTWPLLGPTTYFVLIISTINSFKVFNAIYILAGSPV
ncbi:MAG: carbohydrate ABC transporter permease, partial [Candidatus Dormibacteraceae bacterium]